MQKSTTAAPILRLAGTQVTFTAFFLYFGFGPQDVVNEYIAVFDNKKEDIVLDIVLHIYLCAISSL